MADKDKAKTEGGDKDVLSTEDEEEDYDMHEDLWEVWLHIKSFSFYIFKNCKEMILKKIQILHNPYLFYLLFIKTR